MALQVWLPLNGDGHNQGLLNLTPTTLGTVSWVNDGKIGKALSAGTSTQTSNGISYGSNLINELGTQFSCSIWVRPLGDHVHYNGTFISSGDWNSKRWAFGVSQNNSQVDVFGTGHNKFITCAVPVNTWTHLVCTNDNGLVKLYKNGQYVGERTVTAGLDSNYENFTVGRETYANGYFSFNGNINDVRIYNHVLSPREVAEIAKGLVLHYPLSDWNNASNIVYNGFGEHGSDSWTSDVTVETTDLPSADTTIKASFTRGVTTDYIPINPNNTYAVSCYLKALSGATGQTYPSIEPYDIDKKFIHYFHCAAGFNNTWKTTLSQPLNTGDTVIHATDISNWSTANNNYYYFVSIFGYRDSTGHLYPDMEYTQDSPMFGTYSDKSNLNKTNNTITLNAPYTGAPRPAGTVICQSTAGSTYFYPFGGVQVSTIADWTQKSATVNFGNEARLRNARYIKWQNYSGAKYAGIKITDTTWGSDVVYDTSGFGYNGTKYETLTYSSDTPRYNIGCFFNNNGYIDTSYKPQNQEEITIAFWFKFNASQRNCIVSCYSGDNSGSFIEIESFDSKKLRIHFSDENKVLKSWILNNTPLILGEWYFCAVTYAKNTHQIIVYINDDNSNNLNNYSDIWQDFSNIHSSAFNIRIGGMTGNNIRYNGYISDLRIYATALTADQVKQLYEAPISLANNGTLFANEFNET